VTLLGASGHGWGLALFPLVASAIAAVFAVMLGARFVRRRRPHEGAWTVALAMYAIASFAMFLGVVRGWEGSDYRLYWVLGAVLNVPFLLLGEVYLLARSKGWAHAFAVLLVLGTAFATIKVSRAPISHPALAGSLPLGKEVFGTHALAYRLAQLYSIPAYFLLLGGLTWSAWQMRGRPELHNRAAGAFGIAAGATLVAVGSGIGAAFHVVPLFSASLAAGIAVMFWSFLVASRPSTRLSVTPPSANAE
jgi:hypothetical protein